MKLMTGRGMQLFGILTLAALPLLFDSLASLNLTVNSGGLSPFLVLLLRSLQCAGFATAAILPAVCMTYGSQRPTSSHATVLPLTVGVLIAIAAVSNGSSPLLLLAAGIAVYAAAQAFQIWSESRMTAVPFDSKLLVQTGWLPCLCMVCSMMAGFGSFDTANTSSLLFSERTVVALQRGVEQDLIAESQANRLVSCVQTAAGEVTVWRRAGNVLEFQRNGVPIGRVSTDTSVSPQPAEEFFPAILGLASHPHPARSSVLDYRGIRSCLLARYWKLVFRFETCQLER